MIEIVEGFPESIVGFIAKGRVSRQDYTDVLIPAVEAALHKRERIRCYYEFGSDFAGFDAAALGRTQKLGSGTCRAGNGSPSSQIPSGFASR